MESAEVPVDLASWDLPADFQLNPDHVKHEFVECGSPNEFAQHCHDAAASIDWLSATGDGTIAHKFETLAVRVDWRRMKQGRRREWCFTTSRATGSGSVGYLGLTLEDAVVSIFRKELHKIELKPFRGASDHHPAE